MTLDDLFEAAIPATNYGYWIASDGTFYPVDHESHSSVLEKVFKKLTSYKDAYTRGWVRIVKQDKRQWIGVDLQRSSISPIVLSALSRFLRSESFQEVTMYDPETHEGKDCLDFRTAFGFAQAV